MSDYEDDEDDEDDWFVDDVSDPNRNYDENVQSLYNITVPMGRVALSMTSGDFDRAYDLLQKTSDLQSYLEQIGAIRAPMLDYEALLKFCASGLADSFFEHSRLIQRIPYDILKAQNLSFVVHSDNELLCAQDAQINAMCANAHDQRACYENELQFTQLPTTDSSVVLSKQLMRFMCKNVMGMMRAMQWATMERIDRLLEENWDNFRAVRGGDRLNVITIRASSVPHAFHPVIVISISKNDHILLLKNDFGMSDTQARKNTNLETFKSYVKRRVKNELLLPNARRFERAFMKNNNVRFDVTASP